MKDKELLDCPFCGGKPKLMHRKNDNWDIGCESNLLCYGWICTEENCDCKDGYGNKAEAIKAWNTRVDTRPSQEADWEKGKMESNRVVLAEITHCNKKLKERNRFVTGQMKDDGFYFEVDGEMSYNWDIVKWIYIDTLFSRTLLKPEGKEEN